MQPGEQPVPSPTEAKPRSRYRYRSAFWGVVLIGIGAVLLLYNFDVVSRENLAMLALLWPILLVGIGVDLLVGRRSWALGGLVGVVTVGVIIALMFVGPSAGWIGNAELKSETVSTPVGQATSADVSLDVSSYGAKIHALQASTAPERPLLTADVVYQGTLDFQASGDQQKSVSIDTTGRRWWWSWLELAGAKPWDVGLDPTVPLDLSVRCSSGSSELDLAGVALAGLAVDMSSGDTEISLPGVTASRYPVDLHMSSGDLVVRAAAGAQFDMSVDMSSGDTDINVGVDADVSLTFNGSSGEFTLNLAPGQALRLEVRSISSGDIDLPSGMAQLTKGDDEDEGVWQTGDYDTAAHKVQVLIEHMSSGDVNIRIGS